MELELGYCMKSRFEFIGMQVRMTILGITTFSQYFFFWQWILQYPPSWRRNHALQWPKYLEAAGLHQFTADITACVNLWSAAYSIAWTRGTLNSWRAPMWVKRSVLQWFHRKTNLPIQPCCAWRNQFGKYGQLCYFFYGLLRQSDERNFSEKNGCQKDSLTHMTARRFLPGVCTLT